MSAFLRRRASGLTDAERRTTIRALEFVDDLCAERGPYFVGFDPRDWRIMEDAIKRLRDESPALHEREE